MDVSKAVAEITALILQESAAYNREYCAPGFDADRSDDRMKEAKRRIEELRRMREGLEGMES